MNDTFVYNLEQEERKNSKKSLATHAASERNCFFINVIDDTSLPFSVADDDLAQREPHEQQKMATHLEPSKSGQGHFLLSMNAATQYGRISIRGIPMNESWSRDSVQNLMITGSFTRNRLFVRKHRTTTRSERNSHLDRSQSQVKSSQAIQTNINAPSSGAGAGAGADLAMLKSVATT